MTSFKTTEAVNRLLSETYDTTVEGSEWDVWEAWDRVFVRDLPWHQRLLIWLFPRMYILEDYPVE